MNFFTSHLGKTAKFVCSACFGKGFQLVAALRWQVNRSNVRNLSEARIQEEQLQYQRYFHIEVKASPSPPTQSQLQSKH